MPSVFIQTIHEVYELFATQLKLLGMPPVTTFI